MLKDWTRAVVTLHADEPWVAFRPLANRYSVAAAAGVAGA
jgi:hypothetical protein